MARKTIVWTNGCFDLLHPGHLYILEESKKLGDILVVGLNTDHSVSQLKGPNRPVQGYDIREENLLNTGFVDKVIPIDMSPLEAIKQCKPDIITKGNDYKKNEVIGYEYAKVQIIGRIFGFSTTRLVSS